MGFISSNPELSLTCINLFERLGFGFYTWDAVFSLIISNCLLNHVAAFMMYAFDLTPKPKTKDYIIY